MPDSYKITIQIRRGEANKIHVECWPQSAEYTYAFYLYHNDKLVDKLMYQKNPFTVYWLSDSGKYYVRAFILDKNGNKISDNSPAIQFEGLHNTLGLQEKKKESHKWLKNICTVTKEIWTNRKRLVRIARYDFDMTGKDAYLGRAWNILTPLIEIGAYWFVFGLGLRNNSPVDGHPYLVWMLCGLIPWFFISKAIVKGAGSIYSKANIALRLRYPVACIPAGSIVEAFLSAFAMLIVLFATLLYYGYYPSIYWLNILYYLGFCFVFFTGLAMVTATLTMIARDFQLFINAIMRLLFFITPILWTIENLSPTLRMIMQLNPFLYVVDGFRDSILYNIPFYAHIVRMPVFLTVAILLWVWGCNMLMRFKDDFLDLL